MRRRWILPVVVATAAASTGLAVSPVLATEQPTARSSTGELVQQLRKLLPDDHQARRASAGLDADPTALSVIDPDDYECSQDTPFYNWISAQTAGWTTEQLLGAQTILEYDVADLDAAFFPEPRAARFFGADGEYTRRLLKDFGRLRGFWDIPSSDIELVPVHGGDAILDIARSARAIEAGLGLSPEDAAAAATMLKQLADQDVYQHGDLPLFTVNAFAVLGQRMVADVPPTKVSEFPRCRDDHLLPHLPWRPSPSRWPRRPRLGTHTTLTPLLPGARPVACGFRAGRTDGAHRTAPTAATTSPNSLSPASPIRSGTATSSTRV
ncbi:hypothetical protein AB0M54_30060 [Actinoplanes sp. NPDC051470]|uniref:hypothetical protein n=1 Tax=Actinoplanes sp. NPDC051470 TaxID=3157224 RepID=UPI003446C67B